MDKRMEHLHVKYQIQPPDSAHWREENEKNLERLTELLGKTGVSLKVDEAAGTLDLRIIAYKYEQVVYRKAGARKKLKERPSELHGQGAVSDVCRYSDILYMMSRDMSDRAIQDKIHMPPATYARHKKKMLASDYVGKVDRNRVNDLTYLRSVPGDRAF